MSEVNMFETGTRLNILFQTNKGLVGISDLWKAPLTQLNTVCVNLHKELQEAEVISFIEKPTKKTSTDQLKFDIAKYILDKRLAENELAAEAAKINERKRRLDDLIIEKRGELDKQRTLEDLEKERASL